jgi:hypothetical protein
MAITLPIIAAGGPTSSSSRLRFSPEEVQSWSDGFRALNALKSTPDGLAKLGSEDKPFVFPRGHIFKSHWSIADVSWRLERKLPVTVMRTDQPDTKTVLHSHLELLRWLNAL